MIYFNKWLKIPGPKDLGMSDSNNAMPSDFFAITKTKLRGRCIMLASRGNIQ